MTAGQRRQSAPTCFRARHQCRADAAFHVRIPGCARSRSRRYVRSMHVFRYRLRPDCAIHAARAASPTAPSDCLRRCENAAHVQASLPRRSRRTTQVGYACRARPRAVFRYRRPSTRTASAALHAAAIRSPCRSVRPVDAPSPTATVASFQETHARPRAENRVQPPQAAATCLASMPRSARWQRSTAKANHLAATGAKDSTSHPSTAPVRIEDRT